MLFGMLISALMFFALLCVLIPVYRPFYKNDAAPHERVEYDKAFYKERIIEIKRDLALGRLSEDEAQTTLTEEGRKLIAIANSHNPISSTLKTHLVNKHKFVIIVSLLLIPLISMPLYLHLGNPSIPDHSLASRLELNPETQSISDLISLAEARLKKTPNDLRGWMVLAPIYTRLGQHDQAINAWANVIRIKPDESGVRIALAESMLAKSNGVVSSEIQNFLQAELEFDPTSQKAKFYLAIALGQEGKHAQALESWDDLINDAPTDAPWLSAAKKFKQTSHTILSQSLNDQDVDPETNQETIAGPTEQQIEAASEMSEADRKVMIMTMVEGLSEKLGNDPTDKPGWQRLIRSYLVLGDKVKAQEAILTALQFHNDDEVFVSAINEFKKVLEN